MTRSLFRCMAAAAVLALVLLSGCGRAVAVYDSGAGLTIVMHEGMEPFAAEGAVMALADERCMMTAQRESLEGYTAGGLELGAMSLEEYAHLTALANGLDGQFESDENGNLYLSRNVQVEGGEYYYHTVVYRGSDAFWLLTFACSEELAEDYAGYFTEWSDSVNVP